jgi:hypothetical protein
MSRNGIHGVVHRAQSTVLSARDFVEDEDRALLLVSHARESGSTFFEFVVSHARSRTSSDEEARMICERFRGSLKSILGLWPTEASYSDKGLSEHMLALTPLLRWELLMPRADGRPLCASRERVPFVLAVLHVFVALAMDAGLKTVTYQTVMSVFRTQRQLIMLLGLADAKVLLRPDATVNLHWVGGRELHRAYIRCVKRIIRQRRTATLADILCAASGTHRSASQMVGGDRAYSGWSLLH